MIADERHWPFLNLLNILSRDCDKGLSEEYITRVELGMEAHSMSSDEQSSCQNDCIRKGAWIALNIFFVGLENDSFEQVLGMLAVYISQKNISVQNVWNVWYVWNVIILLTNVRVLLRECLIAFAAFNGIWLIW